MRFEWLIVLGLSALAISSITSDEEEAELSSLAERAYGETQAYLKSDQRRRHVDRNSCTPKTLRIRREWGSLSKSQRKSYIRAVQCLQSKPSRTPSALAPGAKSRFDDFVATHINQTLSIHYTANFLSWHRYFTWSYEEALRSECGYRGDQPYWDWSKTARTGLLSSPIFDGSDTSMSGNGASVGDRSDIAIGASSGLEPIYLPTGSGGGCVMNGPFANMSVNLGPVALDLPGGVSEGAPSGNPLDWNPRCLKRDLVDEVNRRFANASSVLGLLGERTVYDFQMRMQGVPGSGDVRACHNNQYGCF